MDSVDLIRLKNRQKYFIWFGGCSTAQVRRILKLLVVLDPEICFSERGMEKVQQTGNWDDVLIARHLNEILSGVRRWQLLYIRSCPNHKARSFSYSKNARSHKNSPDETAYRIAERHCHKEEEVFFWRDLLPFCDQLGIK